MSAKRKASSIRKLVKEAVYEYLSKFDKRPIYEKYNLFSEKHFSLFSAKERERLSNIFAKNSPNHPDLEDAVVYLAKKGLSEDEVFHLFKKNASLGVAKKANMLYRIYSAEKEISDIPSRVKTPAAKKVIKKILNSVREPKITPVERFLLFSAMWNAGISIDAASNFLAIQGSPDLAKKVRTFYFQRLKPGVK